jgi:hypothetical protein
MSTTAMDDRLGKYESLLHLALAQVDAIDAGDQKTLDRIIDRKWSIIQGLSGTKDLLKTEPSLAQILEQIQVADKLAEQKLTARMGAVRNRLCLLNKQNAAKQMYAQASRKKHPILGLAVDDSTPRFFDIQS